MSPYAVIIGNGELPSRSKVRAILRQASRVVCADGGARHAVRFGIHPDVVIGDLDSLTPGILERLKSSKIIASKDQDQTDLEKAIRYLLRERTRRIVILGATGKRVDQTLANIALLEKYCGRANLTLVDATGEIEIVDSRTRFRGRPGATVSLLPVAKAARVTTKGLRYSLKKELLEVGSRGVSNVVVHPVVEIEIHRGKLLLVKLF
jgi:thiamine pyrophosphokinase